MWCDNCLCLFPLRAGAMVLGTIMMLYQIAAGAFLFKYGFFFFTVNYYESQIYAGFAFIQVVFALIGIIALSTRSYVVSRFVTVIYPVILLLGAVRAGVMAWSLNHYMYRITWTCENQGISWLDKFNPGDKFKYYPPDEMYTQRIPQIFCDKGIPSVVAAFTVFLIIDFLLMCYYNFLLWRFNVRLQHYPVQKGEFVYP